MDLFHIITILLNRFEISIYWEDSVEEYYNLNKDYVSLKWTRRRLTERKLRYRRSIYIIYETASVQLSTHGTHRHYGTV